MKLKQKIKKRLLKAVALTLFACTLLCSGAGIVSCAAETAYREGILATVTASSGTFGRIAAGEPLFSDRDHAFSETIPDWMIGKSYLKVAISASVTVTAKSAGKVFVITQTKGNDSQISSLTAVGFTRVDSLSNTDFCATLKYGVAIMEKELAAGETVSYSKWGILVADFALDTQATVSVSNVSATEKIAQVGEIIFAGGTHAFAGTMPQGLCSQSYLCAPISNGATVRVTESGWLYAIVATSGSNSQLGTLEAQGFSTYASLGSKVVSSTLKEPLVMLAKPAVKGETVSFGKWAILFTKVGEDMQEGDLQLENFASVTVGAGEVGTVAAGESLFVDRTYTVASSADEALMGKSFWKGYLSGGGVAKVTASGWVYVLTPNATYEHSQVSVLKEQGFEEIAAFAAKTFSSQLKEALVLFGKEVDKGESVTFDKWGILFAEVTPERTTNVPPTVIYNPTAEEYLDGNRLWQGIPGIAKDDESGRLWATWYSGGEGEGPYNWVVLYTSEDDGKSWTGPMLVIDHEFPIRAFDPNLWTDPNGRMWLFWSQSYTHDDGIFGTWAMYTENPQDENPTWSDPVRIANGIAMNDPIVLANGDWILPTAIWAISPEVAEYAEERYSNAYISKDSGETWSYLGSVPSYEGDRNADENMIICQPDGSLRMLIRTKLGIEESYSVDGGKTWSGATDAGISPVVSRFYVATLASGNQILIYNDPPTGSSRTHLTAALSTDGGQTWAYKLVIDARSAVTYPDAFQDSDGFIYIIYDHGRGEHGEIVMAKITEEDIIAGELINADSFLERMINNNLSDEQAEITGASVILGSDLSIRYYLDLKDSSLLRQGDLSARFTVNGETVTVTEYEILDGEYVFVLRGIAPQQLGDRIDAEVYAGSTRLCAYFGYSISEYCKMLLRMSAEELGLSDARHTAMKELSTALLYYGVAAREYTGYCPDAPILDGTEILSPVSYFPTEESRMRLEGNQNASFCVQSATVRFDTANRIRVKIHIAEELQETAVISVNGQSYTVSQLERLGDEEFRLNLDEISATAFDSVCRIVLFCGNEEYAVLVYSVNAYVLAITESETVGEEMKALAIALYRYGRAADAYVAA